MLTSDREGEEQGARWRSYFKDLQPLSKNFVIEDRIVWVDIVGLPFCAWSPSAFKKVASLWGEVMLLSEDQDEALLVGRVEVTQVELDSQHSCNEHTNESLVQEPIDGLFQEDIDGGCVNNDVPHVEQNSHYSATSQVELKSSKESSSLSKPLGFDGVVFQKVQEEQYLEAISDPRLFRGGLDHCLLPYYVDKK
ncbi:hypothetical protein L1987_06446 [Smallanthus sonchifolius]|uniref:Uncharacterized protein n=1 Tax=Smallanthus sonchifolius TaxID=185202 RepID=A0ACB9JYA5_9ASTR|nr:hypothetical protein L1987_06446 [Smallanthus sonchifolius]